MPPKAKVSRQEIVRAAVGIVREKGEAALNAREVAARISCSTQPIFSNFETMEELRKAVILEAQARYEAMMDTEIKEGKYPPYKASGMAYIRFAKEERELFRILYMRDREAAEQKNESPAFMDRIHTMVQGNTGLEQEQAGLFHLEMWAYVHGIAAMSVTGYLELGEDMISQMLTDAYRGLVLLHTGEKG